MSPRKTVPFVRSIFHPSDFSDASEVAFAHALALAVKGKCELSILHAGGGRVGDWSRFPPVRKTLERWRLLAPGSSKSEVLARLGVDVTKVSARGNPVRASLAHIDKQLPELVVLATGGREGLQRWLRPSVAQAIARRTQAMTLFVPRGSPGIVSPTGSIQLHRILLPVDFKPDPREAAVRAARIAEAFGGEAVEIVTLHVNGVDVPRVVRSPSRRCSWTESHARGDVADAILVAASRQVDLIIMATEGRQGIVDALRGSVTERVVRGAPCPVLAVPAGGHEP